MQAKDPGQVELLKWRTRALGGHEVGARRLVESSIPVLRSRLRVWPLSRLIPLGLSGDTQFTVCSHPD
jgi:hypothetical protein